MLTRPADLDEEQIRASLLTGWGITARSLEYHPVGFGSYHWLVVDQDDGRWFVTVDDLDAKRRDAGESADVTFGRLVRAFSAAHALHHDHALGFVVAPIVHAGGLVVARLTDRFSLVVHPFVNGQPAGRYGNYASVVDRDAVLDLLVGLHRQSVAAVRHAAREDGVLPHRDELRRSLDSLSDSWQTGPFGEPSRALLATHADHVRRLLQVYDGLVPVVVGDVSRMVVTHGEPHAANVLVTDEGVLLVDWDTLLIAPPERDLWVLDPGDGSVVHRYEATTGVRTKSDVLSFYRMWFDLVEIGGYLALFRRPHTDDADTATSWDNLRHFLQPRARWPSFFQ